MSVVTDEIRASATEFYKGNEICQEKSKFLLSEVGMPRGLLPMEDMEECGYVKETGFVWLRAKKKTEHKFEQIGKLVQYAAEVTAYVEPKKIKKLTGVKAKELMLWVTISEICLDDPPTGKIHFKNPIGIAKTFPVSAFELPEEEEKKEDKEEVKENAAATVENAVEVKENGAAAAAVEKAVEVKEV